MTLSELIVNFDESTTLEIIDRKEHLLLRDRAEFLIDDPTFADISDFEIDTLSINGNTLIVALNYLEEN